MAVGIHGSDFITYTAAVAGDVFGFLEDSTRLGEVVTSYCSR